MNTGRVDAYQTLTPLSVRIEDLTPNYKRKVIYLLYLNACGNIHSSACIRLAKKYLKEYPAGKYVRDVNRTFLKKNNLNSFHLRRGDSFQNGSEIDQVS